MAILRLSNGKTYTEIREIQQYLGGLNVRLEHIPVEEYCVKPEMSKSLKNLFAQEILNLSEKQEILQALSPKSRTGQEMAECTWCELMAVNPSSPNLYQLLAQGSRPHRQNAKQIIYLLTGELILGFSNPDGLAMELLLQAQDCLTIPKGFRHWLSLSALLQVKAIKYFTVAKNRTFFATRAKI